MATDHPNLPIKYDWPLGEFYKADMDNNLLALGNLAQISVASKTIAMPPATPNNGDRFIVGIAATDAWLGHEGKLAVFINGNWIFYPPKIGWLAYVLDTDILVCYKTAGWSAGIAI